MATGTLDANGVWIYGEDDPASPVSDLLNLGMDSVSDAVGDAKARLTTLEGLGMWTAYTPTLTATTNPNIGTTGTRTGAYTRIGKTVHWRAYITVGGTGIAVGTGSYRLSMPVAPAANQRSAGSGWIYPGAFKPFVIDPSTGVLIRTDNGAYVDHTIGMTAAGHLLSAGGTYEAA